MGAKVAIMIEGEVRCHAACTTGNYASLCGLDGDDPGLDMKSCDVLMGQKIDCPTCIQIIRAARTYRVHELEKI